MDYQLTTPSALLLNSYLEALREGDFNPMQLGFGKASAAEIEADPAGWLGKINSPAPFPVTLGNGHTHHITRHELLWLTDGNRFLGTVALRYAGDAELLDLYAGHIGLAVRPGLLHHGHGPRAIRALRQELAARFEANGLRSIIATCNGGNATSARLIEYCGGVLEAETADLFGHGPSRRYRIELAAF